MTEAGTVVSNTHMQTRGKPPEPVAWRLKACMQMSEIDMLLAYMLCFLMLTYTSKNKMTLLRAYF